MKLTDITAADKLNAQNLAKALGRVKYGDMVGSEVLAAAAAIRWFGGVVMQMCPELGEPPAPPAHPAMESAPNAVSDTKKAKKKASKKGASRRKG